MTSSRPTRLEPIADPSASIDPPSRPVLRVRRRTAAAAAVVGALVMAVPVGLAASRSQQSYQATSIIAVAPDPPPTGDAPALNADQTNLFVQGEIATINSRPLRDAVRTSLDDADIGSINASQVGATSLIQIIAIAPSAHEAADAANTAVAAYRNERLTSWTAAYQARLQLLQQQADAVAARLASLNTQSPSTVDDAERAALQTELTRILASQGVLTGSQPSADQLARVVEPAEEDTASTTSSWARLTVIAALVGGVAGLAIAIACGRRRRRMVDVEDVDVLAPLPVLLSLPTVVRRHGSLAGRLGAGARPRLPTSLQTSKLDLGAARRSTLVVVSPSGAAGTTYVAARIAATSARFGPTLLVCAADALNPKPRRRLGVDAAAPGIRDAYGELLASPEQVVDLSRFVVPSSVPNISVLPAGAPGEPVERSLEHIAPQLMKSATAAAPRVVIDSPSLQASGAALEWARGGAAMVLVIGLGVTCADDAADAAAELQRLGADVIGIVVDHPPRRRGTSNRPVARATAP